MVELLNVFRDAALPQKLVLVFLLASVPGAFLAGWVARHGGNGLLRSARAVCLAAPAIGLLVGAMDAFHMMDTTLRLAVSPTAKDLAPGVMEIAALVGLGALSGLVGALFGSSSSRGCADQRDR
jgi:uncharacterized membrane protein YfcA